MIKTVAAGFQARDTGKAKPDAPDKEEPPKTDGQPENDQSKEAAAPQDVAARQKRRVYKRKRPDQEERPAGSGEAKRKRFSMKRWWPVLVVLAVLCVAVLGIDRYVVWSTRSQVFKASEWEGEPAAAILVLGALVHEDGSLSEMLEDRMQTGVQLYEEGAAPLLILSGDGQSQDYDEPEAMKRYALEHGVPKEAILLDKAGLSTYDSVWRAGKTGGYDSLIIVTQEYHLYRTLYIADALGIKACGVSATLENYPMQFKRDIREIVARNKDFFQCIRLPQPSVADEPLLPASGKD